MPNSAPTVTTPVPPIPVTTMLYVLFILGTVMSGISGMFNCSVVLFFIFGPITETKLGQNPLTQEKSLLHELWSIFRFLPSSVSSGRIETQFDFIPQSPQPSQTSEFIKILLSGSGNKPFFLRRLFSAAHV